MYRHLFCSKQVVFRRDLDDIAAVETALRDGTLNGTVHSAAVIDEMQTSGVFWSRYSEFIRKYVHTSSGTIEQKLREWHTKYADIVDPRTDRKLGMNGLREATQLQLDKAKHLVDLEDHNVELRPKPGSKHRLTRWRSSRGAKVEIYHGSSKYFANQGTNHETFQALQMDGTTRFNARRREEAKQQVGVDGDDSARAATSVPHFRPWVWRERNRLADQAGLPLPYPEVGTTRPTDNGERFFMEYAFEQAARRGVHGGTIDPAAIVAAGGCPCFECKEARRVSAGGCGGGASSSSAGGATSLAAPPPAEALIPAPTRIFGRGRQPGADAAPPPPPGAVAAEAPPTPAAAAAPDALAAAAPLVWQPQANPAAPGRGGRGPAEAPGRGPAAAAPGRGGRGGRGPAEAPGHGLLAPWPPLAPAVQPFFVGSQLAQLPPGFYLQAQQHHAQLYQQAAPRASKKSKRDPNCTCGALVRTQQQRAAQGSSGPGGFTAQHTAECAWKQHFSGSGGGGEAGAEGGTA
jgi:hypothetical protein